jgi:hypothetical protein
MSPKTRERLQLVALVVVSLLWLAGVVFAAWVVVP